MIDREEVMVAICLEKPCVIMIEWNVPDLVTLLHQGGTFLGRISTK